MHATITLPWAFKNLSRQLDIVLLGYKLVHLDHVVGAFVARLHISQATLIPTRRWNTKCKSAFGTLQVVQNSSREIMKLTPLEVPTCLLRQPQDGNSNSQSRINRPVTSNNTNLNKNMVPQKGGRSHALS